MLRKLAMFVLAHRRAVIGVWLVLTVFGGFAAPMATKRMLTTFSIPGSSSYQANLQIVKTFGNGDQPPLVLVLRDRSGDVTSAPGVQRAIAAAVAANHGARVSSYFTTHSDLYVSADHHVTFAEIYPAGANGFGGGTTIGATQRAAAAAAPAGVSAYITGQTPLEQAAGSGGSGGPSILLETAIGGLGALIILLFVFGTLPAVAMPLLVAAASILNTFTVIWLLTYITDVSVIVEFLVALVGLGIAIDYSLLFIFRFREELESGAATDQAVIDAMEHAGRSVIVSGSTVGIGLLSMIILPIPFIRSIGYGGLLIPTVSVIAAITFLPAMLSVLGHRINRLRVLPRGWIGQANPDSGPWSGWAGLVTRHAFTAACAGIVIVILLLIPASQLNPGDAQAKDQPGSGPAITGRDVLAAAGISASVLDPYAVAVRGAGAAGVARAATAIGRAEGMVGAVAPAGWSRNGLSVIEAFPATDSASAASWATIGRLDHTVIPAIQAQLGAGAQVQLAGSEPQSRDFEHTVYGNFPYVLLFVVVLTYILLARAFRSLILPLKAVLLNLVSLGSAFGIVVFVFQQGHGSESIWSVPATGVIISWIPLMIFAFLYGISMDYEVFMLTRMREIYDVTGDTSRAVVLGLERTGKLVTSAALILMFAFLVLSSSPGVDVRQFAIGLSAGIIFDATVIRALLVPSLMTLLGRWNWWLPHPIARLLLVRPAAAEG
ncbi:MAG TPA: MMPL family transporter [Thermoleophilia bacterium]|nr:MMPL family transporter [Thermoleophilia bacterium]